MSKHRPILFNINQCNITLLCITSILIFYEASILIFYEANFVARKTRRQLNQSPPNFPDIFVFTVPNAIEISFFQIHPKSGVMGQSGKVKGSVDSPCEMEATESEESEERDKTGLAGISGNS